MWKVHYKPNNDIQEWLALGCYNNKAQAFIHASRVSSEYFMVEVIDPDGSVAWSHYN
jgi:hypothetical protein